MAARRLRAALVLASAIAAVSAPSAGARQDTSRFAGYETAVAAFQTHGDTAPARRLAESWTHQQFDGDVSRARAALEFGLARRPRDFRVCHHAGVIEDLASLLAANDDTGLADRRSTAARRATYRHMASAEREYRQSLAMAPDNAPARIRLGRLLHRRGRFADARQEFARARALPLTASDHYLLMLFLSSTHEAEGDTALAHVASRHDTRLSLAAAAAAWLSMVALWAQPEQVFRTAVDTVVLDVAVSRGGEPVRGLTAKHFRVVDNGTERPAAQVFHDAVPLNLVLCFDTSSSLGSGGLERLRDAADGLLQSLRPDDRVGLVTFAEAVDVRVLPTTRHDDVRTALRLLTSQGPTAWRDALFVASQLVEPTSRARAVVLLLTDGEDTSSWMLDAQVEDVMGRTGVVVHGIELERRAPEAPSLRLTCGSTTPAAT